MTRPLSLAACLAAICFNAAPAAAQQVISDRQVGKTLAQVQCGTKSMEEAVRYLNHMRVPLSKLTTLPPDVRAGYRAEIGWRGC